MMNRGGGPLFSGVAGGSQQGQQQQQQQVRQQGALMNSSYGQQNNDYSLYQVQMASMSGAPPQQSTSSFSSASGNAAGSSSGNNFFLQQYGGGMNSGSSKDYDNAMPGSRAISDEMMRHLLMASSSASAPLNTGIQHAGRQQQQQQSHRQPSLSNFNNGMAQVKEEKIVKGKGKGKGSRTPVTPGEKPRRKKKRRAFEFYWEELRGDYAKSHAHLGHNERRAIAQAEWRNVTEREKWQKMADEYNTRMLDEKYKNRPKPPVTANAFFFKEQHQLLRAQQPDLKGGAVLAEISRMWERTSDRTRWIEMQQQDRKRYETEMATYKANQALQASHAL